MSTIFRLIVDSILGLCLPQMRWARSNRHRQVLEYFGKTTEELKNWATSDASIRMTFLA